MYAILAIVKKFNCTTGDFGYISYAPKPPIDVFCVTVWVICLDFGLSPGPHTYQRSEGSSGPAPLSRFVRVFVALLCQTYQYLDVLMLHFRKMLTN